MAESTHGAQHAGQTGPPAAPESPQDVLLHAPGDAYVPLVPHRPWSTVLLVVHTLGVVVGALFALGGVVIFTIAASVTPPDDGRYEAWGVVIGTSMALATGVALGAFVAVAAVVTLGVSIPLTVLSVRGRRAADSGRPGMLHGVAIAAVALGGVGALGQVLTGEPVLSLLGLLFWGMYALLGIAVLRSTRMLRQA
jgi:hypothetical protein